MGAPLFTQATPASNATLPEQARADSGVTGRLNGAALTASAIELALADGRRVVAELQRTARDDARGTQSWIGSFADSPGSSLVLSQVRGTITGFATYDGETYELRPGPGGRHVLYAVDLARLPQRDGVQKSGSGDVLTQAAVDDFGTAGATTSATTSSPVVQDVLIFYTAAAASSVGTAVLQANIQSAVQAALQAYQNSNVGITLNVVGVLQSPVSESGSGMTTTLNNFKSNTTVRSLRDQYGADMAVLVSQDSDWCGYSSLSSTTTTINGVTTSNTDAYSVAYSKCLSNQTFAHEVGHLQGLDHNRENATGTHEYAYSFGYRKCVSNGFLDVMSYACPTVTVPRIANFSNPAVYYNGYATGISYELDPSHSAEAARSLNNTATKVASYRAAKTASAPIAPSSLATTSNTASRVALAWTDNSGNESGFQLQRSSDGVNFTTIATLGSNTTSASDTAVTASTTYYYRVRAYNGAGSSAFSNTLRDTTPAAAAPSAPTNVKAANGANGTAIVTWSDTASNESGFEIRRAKWDPTTGTWLAASKVGSVGANVVRWVNTTGNGKFRYRVRAFNANGASVYVGPAVVTVTGG